MRTNTHSHTLTHTHLTCVRTESDLIKRILVSLGLALPQAVYLSLRTFSFNLREAISRGNTEMKAQHTKVCVRHVKCGWICLWVGVCMCVFATCVRVCVCVTRQTCVDLLGCGCVCVCLLRVCVCVCVTRQTCVDLLGCGCVCVCLLRACVCVCVTRQTCVDLLGCGCVCVCLLRACVCVCDTPNVCGFAWV